MTSPDPSSIRLPSLSVLPKGNAPQQQYWPDYHRFQQRPRARVFTPFSQSLTIAFRATRTARTTFAELPTGLMALKHMQYSAFSCRQIWKCSAI